MTGALVVEPRPTATNGKRGGPPERITVPRAELVGGLMDVQTLAIEGMDAVADALRAIDHLYDAMQGTSPRIKAIEHAVADIADRQARLLNEATVLAGRYDGIAPAT